MNDACTPGPHHVLAREQQAGHGRAQVQGRVRDLRATVHMAHAHAA
jgi:hypothetical protein